MGSRLVMAAAILSATAASASVPPVPAPIPTPEEVAVETRIERPRGVERASFEIRAIVPADEKRALDVEDSHGETFHLAGEAIVTGTDVTAVDVTLEPDLGHYAITVHFGEAGAQRLSRATADPDGLRLAILVDGKIFAVPYVMARLSDSAMVSSRMSREEATRLAERLAP